MKRWAFRIVRVIVFLALVVVLWKKPTGAADVCLTLSPFLSTAALCVGTLSVLGVAIVLLSCAQRRFFCRWICPLGLLQDGVRKCTPFKKVGFWRPLRATGFLLLCATFFALLWGAISPLWLDPLALFGAWFNETPYLWISGVGILLLAFFSPYVWCYAICPCGALQDVLRFLPIFAGKLGRLGFSLLTRTPDGQRVPSNEPPARRRFFQTVAILGVGGFLTFALRKTRGLLSPFRPPGVSDENQFLAQCARCGNCISACPTRFLKPIESNVAQFGTPELNYTLVQSGVPSDARTFCDADCVRCGEVCPTGAIPRLTPEEKKVRKLASIRLDFEKCRLYHQRECDICGRECPEEAISFVWSDEEYVRVPTINEELCTGCGRCVAFCPGEPPYRELGEESDAQTLGPKALYPVPRTPKP
ncbi:MAG: 4Fe-4S binding protein [Planctomycetia bacterium]|nr:4Fe-4S binding protein [Planctomycetia bacterium]